MNNRPGQMVPYLMRMLLKKTQTLDYPAVGAKTSASFRGALKFHGERCVGCRLCQRVCPTDAIRIEQTGEKQYKAIVRLDKCIFCGQCVDSCNKDALENTASFELDCADRASLEVEI